MVSYEDMIRNSPRNTPKMPRNKPPPVPQKAQSADADEVVKKLQALTSPPPNSSPGGHGAAAVAVSGKKPPTPAHTIVLSTNSKKKQPRSLSTGEGSPRIIEGVKLRESKECSTFVQSELGSEWKNALLCQSDFVHVRTYHPIASIIYMKVTCLSLGKYLLDVNELSALILLYFLQSQMLVEARRCINCDQRQLPYSQKMVAIQHCQSKP